MEDRQWDGRVAMSGGRDAGSTQTHRTAHAVLPIAIYALVCWFALRHGPATVPAKVFVYAVLALPILTPVAAVLVQLAASLGRSVAARLRIRRVRRVLGRAFEVARIHPELIDLAAVRVAAGRLAQCPPDVVRAVEPELLAAARHPFAPLRNAVRLPLLVLAEAVSSVPGTGEARAPGRKGAGEGGSGGTPPRASGGGAASV